MMQSKDASGRVGFVRPLLFATGLIVLLAMAGIAREEIVGLLSALHLGLMALAILAGVIFLTVQGVLFSALMAKHGAPATSGAHISAFLVSQPGKYIPGKVWPVVLQAAALGRGHGLVKVAFANLELVGIGIVHVTGLGLACLWLHKPSLAASIVLAAILLGGLIVIMPTDRIAAYLPMRLRSQLDLTTINGTQRHGDAKGRAMLLSAAAVGTNLLASFCVLLAVGEALPRDLYAPVLAVLYLGVAASILALAVPAGLGLREAASVGLGMLLVPEVPSPLIVSVALLMRIWQLVNDAAVFAIGAAAIQMSRHRSAKTQEPDAPR